LKVPNDILTLGKLHAVFASGIRLFCGQSSAVAAGVVIEYPPRFPLR
jgi:hypothetical protein